MTTNINSKKPGQIWTPNWIAKTMVSYLLDTEGPILDPAVGTGAFLKALFELKADREFYGLDVDADVLRENIFSKARVRVEHTDFLLKNFNERFDAIVANPPYVRHHLLSPGYKEKLQKLAQDVLGFKIDGRAGLHVYFFLKCLSLLKDGGKLAFIVSSDIAEGVFARKLWAWVLDNFALEAIVMFSEKASPFPEQDINPVVFFIKKDKPGEHFIRVEVKNKTDELYRFVASGFANPGENPGALKIRILSIKDALDCGLTKIPRKLDTCIKLGELCEIKRGIATGANDFFLLNKEEIENLEIPQKFLKLCIPRVRYIKGNVLSSEAFKKLTSENKKVFLLYLDKTSVDNFPKKLREYLQEGIRKGLPARPLLSRRNPWYTMERREPPPILFAYLGRKNLRFILNEVGALPLTCFLCVYPKEEILPEDLWNLLNHPEVLCNLDIVAKTYGYGALKVEPNKLKKLPIPKKLLKIL